MRVTCDKCGAAYAVDEKRIPEKGARAQCPKCKAVQVVKKPADVAEAPPAAARPAAAETPKPARPGAALADPLASIFGAAPAAPTASPAAHSDPFGGFAAAPAAAPKADPFGFAAAPAAAAKADPFGFAAAPAAAAKADPFGGFAAAPAAAPSADPFGGFAAAPGAADADPFAGLGGAGFAAAHKSSAPSFDPFGASPGRASSSASAPASGSGSDPFAGFDGAGFAASPSPASGAADLFGGSAGFAAPPPSGLPPDPHAAAARSVPPKPAAPEPDPFADIPGFASAPSAAAPPAASKGAPASGPAKVPVVVFGGAASKPAAPVPSPAAAPNPEADFLSAPAADLSDFSLPPAEEGFGSSSKGSASSSLGSGGLELDLGDKSKPAPAASPEPAAPAKKPAAAPAAPRASSVSGPPLPSPKIAERPSHRGRTAALVAVLVVLVGGGAAGYVWLARPSWAFKPAEPVKPKYLPEIDKRLLTWRMSMPGLSGTAEEHLQKGIALYREDRTTSYLSAQEEFKAAIVLDPNNLEAVARYVEALAVGQADRLDAERLAEARELLGAVSSKKPKMALAKRAKVNLLLATGQEELARAEAEEAFVLSAPEEQPEALLAWGRTYLKKSAPIAQEKFEQALQKEPALKRAIFYKGLAAEHAGAYAKAIAAYRERLALDADQRDALRALARVQARVGEVEEARKSLDAYEARFPDVGEPRVMRAEFAYAIDRDLRLADKLLGQIAKDLDKYDDTDRLQYRTLAAAVARERGDLKAASSHVDEALKIDAEWGPAHFQALLVALASEDAAKARQHLNACEQKLADPARFQEYLGRIEAVAGQLDGAIAALRKAGELSPTRVAPKLAAAALLIRRGDENGAWALLGRMLELDPSSISRVRRPVTDYFEPEIQVIEVAAGAFEPDAKGPAEQQWLSDIYDAVVDYHLGELDGPARALDESLSLDSTSLPALIYRAQIELDRKRYDKALGFAKRAAQADAQNAVTNLLVGRALEGQKKTEQARAAYLAAVEQNPRLIEANLRLAELAARAGGVDEARERLLRIVSDDPENLEARIALYKLGY